MWVDVGLLLERETLQFRRRLKVGPVGRGQVGAQLAHCVLAVHKKRRKSPLAAWNICRWSLTRLGYLKGPYKEDDLALPVKMTPRGVRRSMQHAQEKRPLGGGISGSPQSKYAKFRVVFGKAASELQKKVGARMRDAMARRRVAGRRGGEGKEAA